MTKQEQQKQKIAEFALTHYRQHGFSKVPMDDIASGLRISKKTIYKSFGQKEDLVRKLLIDKLNFAHAVIVANIQAQTNVVDEFVEFSKMIKDYFVIFKGESLNRLKHYHLKLANEIITFKNERVIPLIKLLLRDGRRQKIILDIEDEIIIRAFTSSLSSIAEKKNNGNDNLSYHIAFITAFNMLLNGILTKKGKQLLINKRINNENN